MAIDVDVGAPSRSWGQVDLSPSKYVARMFEVQAALDLYLAMLRSREDDTGVTGDEYPPLDLRGYTTSPSPTAVAASSTVPPFIVARMDLLLHLNRAEAPTDRLGYLYHLPSSRLPFKSRYLRHSIKLTLSSSPRQHFIKVASNSSGPLILRRVMVP